MTGWALHLNRKHTTKSPRNSQCKNVLATCSGRASRAVLILTVPAEYVPSRAWTQQWGQRLHAPPIYASRALSPRPIRGETIERLLKRWLTQNTPIQESLGSRMLKAVRNFKEHSHLQNPEKRPRQSKQHPPFPWSRGTKKNCCTAWLWFSQLTCWRVNNKKQQECRGMHGSVRIVRLVARRRTLEVWRSLTGVGSWHRQGWSISAIGRLELCAIVTTVIIEELD